jgi:hypothetical protein
MRPPHAGASDGAEHRASQRRSQKSRHCQRTSPEDERAELWDLRPLQHGFGSSLRRVRTAPHLRLTTTGVLTTASGVRAGPAAREPVAYSRGQIVCQVARLLAPDGQEPVRASNPTSSTADCSLGPVKPVATSNRASSAADCALKQVHRCPSLSADCALLCVQAADHPEDWIDQPSQSRKPEAGNRKPGTSALKGPGDSLHAPQIRGTTHLESGEPELSDCRWCESRARSEMRRRARAGASGVGIGIAYDQSRRNVRACPSHRRRDGRRGDSCSER